MPNDHALPVLYTFRRCPYAMRARLALHASGIAVEQREVDLKRKPAEMLQLSPKGTVPVLHLPDGRIIDESLDVMRWALAQHDPEGWLVDDNADTKNLIARNDGPFKQSLDRYKYPARYEPGGAPATHHRDEAASVLEALDARLQRSAFLQGETLRLADVALLPFVRQFSMVDPPWFAATPWPGLRRWLATFLASPGFAAIMQKPPHPAAANLR